MVQRLSVELLVIAGIGLILGLLGPFDTYQMPLALRLTYWIGFGLIGYAIFRPTTRAAGWLHEMSNIPFPLAIGIAVLVASLPLTLMIGFAINGMQIDGPMLGEGFGILYLQCAGIGIAIFLLMRLIFPNEASDNEVLDDMAAPEANPIAAANDPDPASKRTKLHQRLPPGFPDRIFALGVEDHYVRLHGPDQSIMLLMRLSDAITETDPLEGMQVHRSWWVARDAIKAAKRDGRNLKLVLENGSEIPVSRSYVGKLKQTGWI